jgi:putative flippase GtrA
MKFFPDGFVEKHRNRFRFAFFLLAGGTAAGVNILSRIGFSLVMPYETAIIAAYLCGMTTAYLLNRTFVFTPSGRAPSSEYTRFALVNLAAVAQVWVVSVGLARVVFPFVGFAWHPETVAHVIGVMAPAYTSYLGHKYYSFAPAKKASPGPDISRQGR